jgi:CRISPR-associated protein Csm4
MNTLKFTLRPLTAFVTPLAGDTLFGQLCWAARERLGEARLGQLLDGYVDGAVSGGLRRLPERAFAAAHRARLRARSRQGRSDAPQAGAGLSLAAGRRCRPADRALDGHTDLTRGGKTACPNQNTINRYTGTTGEGQFAPRQVDRSFFGEKARIDVYAVIDERLSADALRQLLADVGNHGYGRDATTGLGKF